MDAKDSRASDYGQLKSWDQSQKEFPEDAPHSWSHIRFIMASS